MTPLLLIFMLIPAHISALEGQRSPNFIKIMPSETSQLSAISYLRASTGLGKCKPCNHCTNQLDRNFTSELRCCPSGCTTPEGLRGKCVDLHLCPRVLDMVKGNRSKESLQYFEESRCEGPGEYSVCCGQNRRPGGRHCHLTAHPPDHSTRCCGVNVMEKTKDTISEGGKVNGKYHPWLLTIVYAKQETPLILCGGALISGQYAVTAAHCVSGPMLDRGTPVSVVLSVPYCNGEEGDNCNDVVVVPIESTTPHPHFEPYINPKKYDIALIKLIRIVEFSDFIRPICLPSFDLWASTMEQGGGDAGTPRHGLPIVIKPQLDVMDPPSGRFVDEPAIAVTIEVEGLFELVGMATMISRQCGETTIDGSFSNAYLYMPWIRSQMAAELNDLTD